MKRVSTKRAVQNRQYTKARREHLEEHPYCVLCGTGKLATEVHHYRGRIGRLLCDKRFFRSMCSEHHSWVHNHPAQARKIGLMAPAYEFNVSPP